MLALRTTIPLLLCVAPGLTQGPPPAKVTATRVIKHVFRPTQSVLGELEAIRAVDLSSEVDGLVEELAVDEGQAVGEGDVLLQLRTKAREIAARGAEAELVTAKEQLAEYERGSRPEEIRAAEEAVVEARALLDEAEDELKRTEELKQSEVGTVKALTEARARAHSRRAVLRMLEARLELVKQGPREEQIARARAQVGLKQAQLDQILDEIDKARILAPFAGVVTKKLVGKGAYARRGDPVLAFVQMDPIRVTLQVPERLVGNVTVGLDVDLTLDAFPGRSFRGKISAVVPLADRLARTFPVKIVLDNAQRRLLPGMVVRGRVPTADGEEGLAVPRDVVVSSARGPAVYAVADGTAKLVPVQTGFHEGLLVQIRGQLDAGDLVVRRGNENLMPGQKIVIIREEAATEVGGDKDHR